MDREYLCVYGQRNHPAVEKWVSTQEGRYVLLFDELFSPFHHEEDPRFLRFLVQEEGFKKAAWTTLFSPVTYLEKSHYPPKQQKIVSTLYQKMEEVREGVFLLASDYKDLGKQILSNFFANIRFLPSARPARLSCPSLPAIICGSGPSLAENIPLLKNLSSQALLFAGGSTLQLLHDAGVEIHAAAFLDPAPPKLPPFLSVPLFYQDRVGGDFLGRWKGPLLRVPPSGGYPMETWFLEELGVLEEPFDGGWNVGSFCTALATSFGCNPIIHVGIDLCREDKTARRDWLFAARWYEEFIAKHPSTHFVNTSTRGIPLQGAEVLSLQDVKEKYMHRKVSLPQFDLPCYPIQEEAIKEAMTRFQESMHRCKRLCAYLLEEYAKSHPSLPSSGKYVLYDVELEEEVAHRVFLKPLWDVWKWVLMQEGKESLSRLLFFQRVFQEGCN